MCYSQHQYGKLGRAMTTTLHEREQAFEAKFAHDEEFRFLFTARRDKLFSQWVATKLRLSDEAGEALVKAVLAIPGGPAHDQRLLKRIADAFSEHDGATQGGELSAALDRCGQQARQQLLETPLDHSRSP
jgi:hypothetical protein